MKENINFNNVCDSIEMFISIYNKGVLTLDEIQNVVDDSSYSTTEEKINYLEYLHQEAKTIQCFWNNQYQNVML